MGCIFLSLLVIGLNDTLYVCINSVAGALYCLRKWREANWETSLTSRRIDGQVAVVTGATAGLGRAAAEDLVSRGATVVLACRNVRAANEVIKEIKRKHPEAKMVQYLIYVIFRCLIISVKIFQQDVVELDLSSLESVRTCASILLEHYPQINILINNAGVSIPTKMKSKTTDGYEINFGVNHLGHFLLTNLLIERLRVSAPSRFDIRDAK